MMSRRVSYQQYLSVLLVSDWNEKYERGDCYKELGDQQIALNVNKNSDSCCSDKSPRRVSAWFGMLQLIPICI